MLMLFTQFITKYAPLHMYTLCSEFFHWQLLTTKIPQIPRNQESGFSSLHFTGFQENCQ